MSAPTEGMAVRSRDPSTYWCADDPDDVQREALTRVKFYYRDVRQSGRGILWRRAYLAYYGLELITGQIHASSSLRPGGEQGELLMVKINELRNILTHILNILTRDPPIYEPQSHDTTTAAEAACDLARDVLAQVIKDQDLDGKNRRAVEYACVLGEGYLGWSWDVSIGPLSPVQFSPTDGSPVMGPNGQPERKRMGDVRIDVYGPHDVIHDIRTPGWDPQWVILRDWVNRYDLIARYATAKPGDAPEAQALAAKRRSDILHLDTRDKVEQAALALWTFGQNLPSDDVAVYTLYHRRSDALPGGRMLRFLDGNSWLFDGPLPYQDVPVERVCAAEWLDRGYTYAPSFDLCGPQEAIDAFWTMFVSIADLVGVPNFLVPDTSNIGVEELAGGGREIRYRPDANAPNGGAPTIMEYPSLPPIIEKGMELLPGAMERLSGVNSVVRGDPAENIKAGNYAALVQSQSAEFLAPMKRSDIRAMERGAKHTLGMYAVFATADRAVVVEGGPRGKRLMSFTGKTLAPIADVTCTMGNPMRETTAGRLMLADQLFKMVDPATHKTAITSEQWMEIVDTGRFELAIDPTRERQSLIDWEKEQILTGCASQAECKQKIPVTPFDNHEEHLMGVPGSDGHQAIVNDPEARKNPIVMQTLAWHIQAHEEYMAQKAMGQGVSPGAGPPPPGMGAPPPPNGHGGPGGTHPSPSAMRALNASPGAADSGVTLPQPAKPPPGAA